MIPSGMLGIATVSSQRGPPKLAVWRAREPRHQSRCGRSAAPWRARGRSRCPSRVHPARRHRRETSPEARAVSWTTSQAVVSGHPVARWRPLIRGSSLAGRQPAQPPGTGDHLDAHLGLLSAVALDKLQRVSSARYDDANLHGRTLRHTYLCKKRGAGAIPVATGRRRNAVPKGANT